MIENDSSYICVGKILGPQGLQGALRVCYYTESPQALMDYKPLYAGGDSRPLSLSRIQPGRRHEAIAQCAEIKNRTAAEALKGMRLWAPRSALPPLEEEEYYYADLVGLAVRLAGTQEVYGAITGVHNFGAGDVLAVSTPDAGSMYIPFQKRAVIEVHCKAGYVVVDPQVIEEIIDSSPQPKGDA
jgi:16S rRNA processing protein RimM